MRLFPISFLATFLVLALCLALLPVRAQQLTSYSVRPPTKGSLVCSAAVGQTVGQCGTTKADYVGAYKLNMSCPSGFYDPIFGGTCWKCPADTDGKGAWY